MAEMLFTRENAWGGGFYELAIELGPATEADIRGAIIRLWSHPRLVGCYLYQNIEPDLQDRIVLDETTDFELMLGQPVGTIILPNDERTNCSSTVIRELPTDDGGNTNWVSLNLPLGGLGYSYPVGAFPFDDHHHLEWRVEVDEMLKSISEYFYEEIKFVVGVIGFELNASDLELVYDEFKSGKVPNERYFGRLWSGDTETLYFPSNI